MIKEGDAYRNIDTSLSLLDRVKAITNTITNDPDYNGWDTQLLKNVQCEEVAPGRTVFSATITPAMCNKGDNLHGGCATTLLDNLTSTSLLTLAKKGYMDTGTVSRTMNVTMLRPVPVGTKIRIICEAVATGRNLAHCRGQIELLDGRVAVTLIHDKAILQKAKL